MDNPIHTPRLWKRMATRAVISKSNLRKRMRGPLVLGLFILLGYGAWGQLPLSQVEGEYFTSEGTRIHYTDEGRGVPVILLHGFAMNQDISWRRPGIIDALSPHFRVIAMDQRGHGLSEKPHDPYAYGIEMARDVIRLMDHLRIKRAHIVGTSMGAIVAMKVMVEYPERVMSAAPCSMGWARPYGPNMSALVRLADSLENGGGVSPLLERLYHGHQPPYWATTAADTLVSYLNDTTALAGVARALAELAVTADELKEVPVPVLTLIGERDPLLKDLEAMRGLVPQHEIFVVEGADHFRLASYPLYSEKLLAFLFQNSE